MNKTLLGVGAASLLLTGAHVFGGGEDVVRPMMAADFDPVAQYTMLVCWHAISAHLLLSGFGLIWVAVRPPAAAAMLAGLISVSFLVFTGLFIGIAAISGIEGAWYKLPQWVTFLPMALAGFSGTRSLIMRQRQLMMKRPDLPVRIEQDR